MESIFGAYLRTRERVTELLSQAPAAELEKPVPACPDWSVHDLLAHLVSLPVALSAGRRPNGPIGEWLDELIVERQGQPGGELIREWQSLDAELAGLLDGSAALLFGDLAIHEHDLRGALNKPDHAALEVDELLPRTLAAFSKPLRAAGLGAIEVRCDGGVWRSHDAAVGWTLLVDPWTAVRAVNSRRTAQELCQLPALGAATPYLRVLDAHLPLPPESLGEA
jgi:uncharacterized protein (TIGR03083 family)